MKKFRIAGCVLSLVTLNGCAMLETDQPAKAAAEIEQTALSDVPSGIYINDDSHTYVGLSYDHLGYSRSVIRFSETDAEINLDKSNIEGSRVSVTIKANSLDTGVPALDERLAKSDFFDFERFPEITFISTDLHQTSPTTGKVTGDLTIKGVTKPATLDVVLNGASPHPRNKFPTLGISASTTLNRSDFDLGYLTPFVGNEIVVQIEGEFNLKD